MKQTILWQISYKKHSLGKYKKNKKINPIIKIKPQFTQMMKSKAKINNKHKHRQIIFSKNYYQWVLCSRQQWIPKKRHQQAISKITLLKSHQFYRGSSHQLNQSCKIKITTLHHNGLAKFLISVCLHLSCILSVEI